MNKGYISKSNPRTPVNYSKYQQNFHSNQHQFQDQIKNSANEVDPKPPYYDIKLDKDQNGCGGVGGAIPQLILNSDFNKSEIYYPQKSLSNLHGIQMNLTGTFYNENSKNSQAAYTSVTAANSQNKSEIISSTTTTTPNKTMNINSNTYVNPVVQQLKKNYSQISLTNQGNPQTQSFQNSQKESQESLYPSRKLHSIVCGSKSKTGSSTNISNYTSEQTQKSYNVSNMNVNGSQPVFQLQPNQEQNKLFSDLISENTGKQYLEHQEQSDKNIQNFSIIDSTNHYSEFMKRHSPIQINVSNQQDQNRGAPESSDCSPLLKNNKYSSKSLLGYSKNQKENQNNISKTPLRKGTNTSKVSLNATPLNQSAISQETQKKQQTKSTQKSTLKIIQDQSSFSSFQQQQYQQQQKHKQSNLPQNVKYGSFCVSSQSNQVQQLPQQQQNQQRGVNNSNNSVQQVQQQYQNKNNNSSQQINPMSSISIQSINSITQNPIKQNEQVPFNNLFEQSFQQPLSMNPSQKNSVMFGKTNDELVYNYEHRKPSLNIQHVTQFTSTCDSFMSSNRAVSKISNIYCENNQNVNINNNNNPNHINQINHNINGNNNQHIHSFIKQQNQESMPTSIMANPTIMQKPSITQEEDYSVPQELQNSLQMNKNISKLNNLPTIRASEIDLLKTTEKLNQSQQKFTKTPKESFSGHQSRGDIEKIQFNIIQNNITLNTTAQTLTKSDSQSKINTTANSNNNIKNITNNSQKYSKPSIQFTYTGKENRREGLHNLFSPPSVQQQQSISLVNPNHITSFNNGNETQRQYNNNRQSIDSFMDVTTKNIPTTFISQEKQTKLSMQHKNKMHRRNCTCDGDENQMESCYKVYEWLSIAKEDISSFSQTILLSQDSLNFDYKIIQQIQKDIVRTYQNYEYFWNPQIQQTIQHVLQGFIKQYPEVGYVQGMNLIVGYLIWHADENCSLQLLLKICKILNLTELLKPGFPDLQKHLKTIEVVMILNCPQIYQILNKYDLHPSMFISEWIIVLLTDIIPLEFSSGWIFVYRLVINLMKILLKVIENLDDQSEILYVLKSVRTKQKEYQINWTQLLTTEEPIINELFIDQIQNHIKSNSIL